MSGKRFKSGGAPPKSLKSAPKRPSSVPRAVFDPYGTGGRQPTPASKPASSTPILDDFAAAIQATNDKYRPVYDKGMEQHHRVTTAAETGAYSVGSGDSLSAIARRMSAETGREISVAELYEANRGTIGDDPNRIQIGQNLSIPGVTPAPATPAPAPAVAAAPAPEGLGFAALDLTDVNAAGQAVFAVNQMTAAVKAEGNQDEQATQLAMAVDMAVTSTAPEYMGMVVDASAEAVDLAVEGFTAQGQDDGNATMAHLTSAGEAAGPEHVATVAQQVIAGLERQNVLDSEMPTGGMSNLQESTLGALFAAILQGEGGLLSVSMASELLDSGHTDFGEDLADNTAGAFQAVTNGFTGAHGDLMDAQGLVLSEADQQTEAPDSVYADLLRAGWDGISDRDALLEAFGTESQTFESILAGIAHADSQWSAHESLDRPRTQAVEMLAETPKLLDGLMQDEQGDWVSSPVGVGMFETALQEAAAGEESWIATAAGNAEALDEVVPGASDGIQRGILASGAQLLVDTALRGTPEEVASVAETMGLLGEEAGVGGMSETGAEIALQIRGLSEQVASGALDREGFSMEVARILGDTPGPIDGDVRAQYTNAAASEALIGALGVVAPSGSPGARGLGATAILDGQLSYKDLGVIGAAFPSVGSQVSNVVGIIDSLQQLSEGDLDAAALSALPLVMTVITANPWILGATGLTSALLMPLVDDDPFLERLQDVRRLQTEVTIRELAGDALDEDQITSMAEMFANTAGSAHPMPVISALASEQGVSPEEAVLKLAEVSDRWGPEYVQHLLHTLSRVGTVENAHGQTVVPAESSGAAGDLLAQYLGDIEDVPTHYERFYVGTSRREVELDAPPEAYADLQSGELSEEEYQLDYGYRPPILDSETAAGDDLVVPDRFREDHSQAQRTLIGALDSGDATRIQSGLDALNEARVRIGREPLTLADVERWRSTETL